MTEEVERSFARTFLNMLSTQSITYSDDYRQPPELSLRKVPVLPIAVPPPPEREPQVQLSGSLSSASAVSLVFKSLKPQATFTISVRFTDTISAIKTQLGAEPFAPPADKQRLLYKGKALADGKLLKEYNNIKEGDIINLMVKPGYDWKTTAVTTAPSPPVSASPLPVSSSAPLPIPKSNPFETGTLHPDSRMNQGGKRHQRIPSVMLSPSSSLESSGAGEKDIMLTIDPGVLPSPVIQSENMSTYHQTMSQPEFWERLHDFLKIEFQTPVDVHSAFEDFLCAAKGSLTASEIAKIRDQVGVIGMAGT